MSILVFGAFQLDTRSLELWRDAKKVRLRPQPCRALAILVSRTGDLVTRDELRAALWPDGVHVRYELGLNSCIKQIRRALGESGDLPRYIETLPGRGYRFSAHVEPHAPAEPQTSGRAPQPGALAIRITAQVLNAEVETVVWANTTDWNVGDPSATTRRISDAVGAAVAVAVRLASSRGSSGLDRTVRLVESVAHRRDLMLTRTRP